MKKYIDICWNAIQNGWNKFWTWYKALYKGRKWYTKTGIGFASFIVAFILYLIIYRSLYPLPHHGRYQLPVALRTLTRLELYHAPQDRTGLRVV